MANGDDDNSTMSQEEFNKLLDAKLKRQTKSNEQIKEEIALRQTLLDLMDDEIGYFEKQEAADLLRIRQLKHEIKAQTDQMDKLLERLATEKDLTDEQRQRMLAQAAAFAKTAAALEKKIALLKEAKKAAGNVGEQFDTWLGKLQLNDSYLKTFSGGLVNAAFQAGGLRRAFDEIGKTLAKRLSPKQIIGTFVGNIEQQTTQMVGKASSAFADFTGQTMERQEDYRGSIVKVARAQATLGVGIIENTKTFTDLYTSLASFKHLNKATQEELVQTANILKRFGVDGKTFGQTIEFAQLALGKTVPEAQALTREMASFSKQLKKSAGEVMKDLTRMEGVIAEFGARGVEEFKKLAKAADTAGVSIDTVASVGKNFDFLEDAVPRIARLNTLLGRNALDAMKVMRAPLEERSRMILDAVKKTMNLESAEARHNKILIAQHLGYRDVGEMMRMVNNQTKELTESQKQLNARGLTQEKLAELAENATPPLTVLSAAMEQFVIFLFPLIDMLREVTTYLAENVSTEFMEFAGVIILISLGLSLISLAFGGIFKVIGKLIKLTPLAAIGTKALTTATGGLAVAATAATPAMAALSRASMGFIIPMTIIAVAIAVVVVELIDFMKVAIKAGVPIMDLALAVTALGFAFAMLGKVALPTLLGAGAVAIGVGALAVEFNLFSSNNLNAVAVTFKSMAAVVAKNRNPFFLWAQGIKDFASAASDSKEDIENISKWIANMNQLNRKVGKVEVIESMTKFTTTSVEGIKEARALIHELRFGGAEDTAKAIENMINAFNTKTQKMLLAAMPKDIVIKLDDYEMGRWVRRKNKEQLRKPN